MLDCKGSILKVTTNAYREFIASMPMQASSFDVPFGFSGIEFIEPRKLIDLDGFVITYFDFGRLIVLLGATKLQVAQMIADKKVDAISFNGKTFFGFDRELSISDFVAWSRM